MKWNNVKEQDASAADFRLYEKRGWDRQARVSSSLNRKGETVFVVVMMIDAF
jgi:hypothetical protein